MQQNTFEYKIQHNDHFERVLGVSKSFLGVRKPETKKVTIY